jgi:hypothetical protein
MNREAIIQKLLDHYAEITAAYEAGKVFSGGNPESPWARAMFSVFEAYTDSVSQIVGDDDEWLSWFIWDNDCGKRGLKAKAASWKRERPIKTAQDLVEIVEAGIKARTPSGNNNQNPHDKPGKFTEREGVR